MNAFCLVESHKIEEDFTPLINRGNMMTNHTKTIQPFVMAMVEMGNGVSKTKVSSPDRQVIRENIKNAFMAAKERSNLHDKHSRC